jgi:DNA-binding MurR/RpiR family transcriptional regulator
VTEFLDACYAAILKQETSIENTITSVNNRAADVLKDKRLIVLAGCGDSYAVADYGKWAFLKVGLNALQISPPEISQIQLSEDCAVIGISASGRSLATIDTLRKAREAKATTIVLTDNAKGTASEFADYVWTTRAGVDSYNISPSSITTTAMAYLLKLAVEFQSMPQSRIHNDINELKHIGKEMLSWAESMGKRIAEVPIRGKPLFMISEGANFAAAQIGMMKFNEYGVFQSTAALTEDYQHHHVLTANQDDGAVLITKSPSKEEDMKYLRALNDTLKMKAFHLFTPEELNLESPLGQAIANSIALQLAAYHNVLKYDPGKKHWREPNVDAFKIY